ncbi:MAG: hypothetical protein D6681_07535, partial [Calditrichaeota bacterium]
GTTDSIQVGTNRRLRVRLQDAFGNVHPDTNVTFTVLNSDARFTLTGTGTAGDLTDASGIAEVDYRSGTQTAFGADSIRVSIVSGLTAVLVIPLKPGSIANFDLTLLSAVPDTAGSQIRIKVTARDIFDNPVVSSQTYQVQAVGSNTAQFQNPTIGPFTSFSFSNSATDTIAVIDTVAGSFVVKARLASDTTKQGTSPQITITPASLKRLEIRTQAGNQGQSLSGVSTSLASTETLPLFAAGFDRYGNYIADTTAVWDKTGTLSSDPPFTFPHTGSSFTFSPSAAGSGTITITHPTLTTVQGDATGIITVTAGNLSFIRIQTDSTSAASEVGDRTFTAGDTLRLYAVGYDADNNRIANVAANWSINNTALGRFQNGAATISNVKTVLFTAVTSGTGVITAKAVSDTTITDPTGLLTVNPGGAVSVTIRNSANNGGIAYHDIDTLRVPADSSITLFAAGYDAFGNYVGEVSVDWESNQFTGIPAAPAPSIVFAPTVVDTGRIQTTALGLQPDTTGVIIVTPGPVTTIKIQNSPTASGQEVNTPFTLSAGQDTTLYTVGYDGEGNFVFPVSSNWSLEGDAIGTFSQLNPSTFNVLSATTSGSAVVRAIRNSDPTQSDITSTITVVAGAPSTLTKIAASDNQTAPVGSQLPRDIEVKVLDAFNNPVVGDTVQFIPLGGGSVSTPLAVTNALGIASTSWTVHATPTPDSLAATVPGAVTVPDTVIFHATVTAGSADTLIALAPTTGTGTVDTDLGNLFTVEVRDATNNPVPGVPISFAIVAKPTGASNETLSVFSDTTNAVGQASTRLHLGTLVGTYTVRAFTASTTPNFVDFTGTATAAAADTILIVSGNNQTGTAGQALADSVKFKVTDLYGNAVSGALVAFTAFDGGSTAPATATSNASGLVATAWTLGPGVGEHRLKAALSGAPLVDSDTVRATANPAPAASVNLVSLGGITADSIAAIAGENVTVVVEVRDAFNNPVSGAVVKFEAVPPFTPIFESSQVTTGADGRATNVVKTDAARDSTFFRALVAGVDTLNLHIYHLSYVAGSLSPAGVSPGDTVAFSLQLFNPSPRSVTLDTANTLFAFDDGTNTFSAALQGAHTLTANAATTLNFDLTPIAGGFTTASYTPQLTLAGSGANAALAGTITLPINSLSLFSLEITQITGLVTRVARGDTFVVTMKVDNLGPETVTVDTVFVQTNNIPPVNITQLSGPTTLSPNSRGNSFTFQIAVPTNAAFGPDTVDGQIRGTTLSGATVSDAGANTPFPFVVGTAAQVHLLSFTPNHLTRTKPFTFTARLYNQGAFDIVLDPASSFITFGQDTTNLMQGFVVPAGTGPTTAITVEFNQLTVTSTASVPPYSLQMKLHGTENGAIFDTTLMIPDTIFVQDPPNIQVVLLDALPTVVSQNQSGLRVQLQLTNAGALNASARFTRPDSIFLSTTGGFSALLPDNNALFPLTLAAGQTSPVIEFTYSLGETYPPGIDTVRVNYSYEEVNSGTFTAVKPAAAFDTYNVLTRSRLNLVAGSTLFTPDTVTPGQQNVDFRFTLQNTGQAPARISAGDISLTFNHNHTSTLISPALPVVIPGGATQEFVYDIDVAANAGVGSDPVDIAAGYTDTISAVTYADLTVNNVDTLQIISGALADILSVRAESATFDFDSVSIGAKNVPVKVRLRNKGNAPLLLDSLQLTFVPPGNYVGSDTLFLPLPLTINPGQSAVVPLSVDVPAGNTPGLVSLNARAFGRDAHSGALIQDAGADTTDSWRLVTPAQLVFTGITPSQVTTGQTVAFQVQLKNSGQATVLLDSTTTFLVFQSDTIFLDRHTLVAGNGAITTLQFDTAVLTVAPVFSIINGSLVANNIFENGFTRDTTFTPVQLDVFHPAAVTVQAFTAPDTVGQEQSFNVQLTLSNPVVNNAEAVIDSLIIPELGIGRAEGSSISGGTTLALTPASGAFNPPIVGDTAITVTVKWHDGVSGVTGRIDSTHRVHVLQEAGLQIAGITAPAIVSPGGNATVTVSVTNTGEVTALNPAVSFARQIGVYSITPAVGNPTRIAGGATVDLVYNFAIAANSGIGVDTLQATASAQDSLNGKTVTASSSFTWSIQQSAQFSITSVTATQSPVSRGEQNVPVVITVANGGGIPVDLDTLELKFAHGAANYAGELSRAYGAQVIPAGGSFTDTFLVDIGAGAQLGTDILDARGVATETVNGILLTDTSAASKGTWTVQQRPVITSTLTLDTDTASTGQKGMLLTFPVQNSGGADTTATAQVDSIQILINGVPNDSANITFTPLTNLPPPLTGGSGFTNLYTIGVRSTAAAGVYTIAARLFYRDANDNSAFTHDSSPVTLVVQKAAAIEILSMRVSSDTLSPGQSNVPDTVRIANIGGATARILSNTLSFSPALPFTQTLISPATLPVDLAGGDSLNLIYLLDVPASGAPGTTVNISASLQAQDLNSSAVLAVDSANLAAVVIEDPANFQFVELLPPNSFRIGDTASFRVVVTNVGGSSVELNGTTDLQVGALTTTVNTALTDLKFAPGETDTLFFNDLVLTAGGSFVPVARLRGTSNAQAFSQNLSTSIILVGGTFTVDVQVNPLQVVPGQKNVQVVVPILSQDTLTVDSAGTRLDFRYIAGGQIFFPDSLQRVDTVRTILPNQNVLLTWEFDIPDPVNTGFVEVVATLSFVELPTDTTDQDTFLIKSGVNLGYKPGTLTPSQIVPGQTVAFSAVVNDSGNTDLIVDPTQSYLLFTDGVDTVKAFVDGNITIRGSVDTNPRPTTVPFAGVTIPAAFDVGSFPFTIVLNGELPSGELFGDTLTSGTDLVDVLSPAGVVVDSINVIENVVTLGQQFVEVRYFLRNAGQSAAQVNSLTSIFRDGLGNDVSSTWLIVSNSDPFPFAIDSSATRTFTRQFNVLNNSPVGVLHAFLEGTFNDTRKPAQIDTFRSDPVSDSVRVIRSSQLSVQSLTLTTVPNPPFVNVGQPFALDLSLNNTGDDTLLVVVTIKRSSTDTLVTDTIPNLTPNAVSTFRYPDTLFTAGTTVYTALIDTAVSLTSGSAVNPGQSPDNAETVEVQEPTALALSAAVDDATLSTGQTFTVSFTVQRTGQSGFGSGSVKLELPPNNHFTLLSATDTLGINPTTLSGTWNVRADSLTAGAFDSLLVRLLSVPVDANTGAAVAVGAADSSDTITVRVDTAAAIRTRLSITSPPGAIDGVLSTQQSFVVRDSIFFIGEISDQGRETEIFLPAGLGFTVEGASRRAITDTSTIVVQEWTVFAPNASASNAAIVVESRGRDRNTLDTVIARDTLVVSVVPRAALEISGQISGPAGAQDGIVSTSQQFDITLSVQNTGVAGLVDTSFNTVDLTLPTGYQLAGVPGGGVPQLRFKTDTTLTLIAPATPDGLKLIQFSLVKARLDTNTNAPAVINVGNGNITVTAQDSARLELAITAPDIVSVGQEFDVVVSLQNQGDASIIPDSVQTVFSPELLQHVELVNPADTLRFIRLVNFAGQDTFRCRAISVGLDTLLARVTDTTASDENVDPSIPVTVVNPNREQRRAIEVRPAAAISLVDSIVAPSGARDGVLSTGQFFTVRTHITMAGSVSPANRAASISVPTGYAVQGGNFVNLSDSVQANYTLTWVILAPSAPAAPAPIIVQVTGRDEFSGVSLDQRDTLTVTTVSRTSLVFNSAVVAPAGAQDDQVSTHQRFVWQLSLVNTGQAAAADSSVIQLSAQDNAFYFDAARTQTTRTIHLLPPDTVLVDVYTDTIPHGLKTLQAVITDTSSDENSGLPAVLNRNVEAVSMITVRRAELTLDIAGPGLVDTSQVFEVTATVTNLGDAAIVPDSVKLTVLNPVYGGFFLDDDSVKYVALAGSSGSATFRFQAFSTNSTGDVIRIAITDTAASDENDFGNIPVPKPVPVDTLPVDVQQGSILLSGGVTAPPGAVDRSLSTGQQFTVQATIVFKPNVDVSGRTAEIRLPSGFVLDASTPAVRPVTTDTTISWLVVAPATAPADSQSITVFARGEDVFTGTPLVAFTFFKVAVVPRAELHTLASVVAPPGAQDSVISTAQEVRVQVQVVNTGVAGTVDSNRVRMVLPTGFRLVNPADSVITLATGDSQTVAILSPDSLPGSPISQVSARLIQAATDENSNAPAAIAQVQADLPFVVVEEAFVVGSLSGQQVFSAGQTAQLTLRVENRGTAGIVPDSVLVKVTSRDTSALRIANDDTLVYVHLNQQNNTVGTATVSVIAGQAQPGPDTLDVAIVDTSVHDENKFATTPVAHQDSTFGFQVIEAANATVTLSIDSSSAGALDSTVSTGQTFRLRAVVSFSANTAPEDRVAALVFPADSGFTVVDSLQSLSSTSLRDTVYWDVTAPGMVGEGGQGRLSALPGRQGRLSALSPPERQHPTGVVSAPTRTAERRAAGPRSRSGGESAVLEATDFHVEVHFTDANSGAALSQISNSLPIEVVDAAKLQVDAAIVAPPGALDARVSTGQQFEVTVGVENLGQAATVDSSEVRVQVPPGFSLPGGGQNLTLQLAEGQSQTVMVTAPMTSINGFVRATITRPAQDENTLQPATTVKADTSVSVFVVERADVRIFLTGPDSVAVDQVFSVVGRITNAGQARVVPNDSLTAGIQFDPARLQLLTPATLRKRLVGDTTDFVWQFRALSTGASTVVAAIDTTLSYDENNYPTVPVHSSRPADSLALMGIDVGTVRIDSTYFSGGLDSLTASTGQQNITLVIASTISPFFDTDAQATVILPGGAFSPDTLTRPLTAQLNVELPVPNQPTSGWQPVQVIIQATASLNQFTVSDTATLWIMVEQRATLLLSGEILSGAANGRVSFGQEFEYQATVSNTGQAGVLGQPAGELTVELGDSLSLVGGASNPTAFQVGVPVVWRIRADSSSVA